MSKTDQYFILKDKRKLGFAEYGESNGFPIVYCHGSQSSRLEMHYDLSFAFKNNLRIITIDRPGHGISDFNSNGTILSFARDTKQLLDYLRIDKFSVAGMSAGSPFSLGIAYLFSKNIHKTTIINGFAPYTKESKKYLSKEVKLMLNFAKLFPLLLKWSLKLQAKQVANNPKKSLQHFFKIMSEPDQKILKNTAVIKVIEDMYKEAFRNGSKGVAYEITNILVKDWGFRLNEIQVPTIFWCGEKDNNTPYNWAKLMADRINEATLKKYPDEGHLLLFNHAEEIFIDLST
ncbi:alpha/beta fold hydrolase [Tenacibaculum xiamenense]|uniref:alpha/beta fold hydrolase n=1 Tax=Tenacibaculum xiamenense TaxID=1261553 RepID=UPI003893405F